MLRPSRLIRLLTVLRDEALQSHPAGRQEQLRADLTGEYVEGVKLHLVIVLA